MSAVDLDPIPLADANDEPNRAPQTSELAPGHTRSGADFRPSRFENSLAISLILVLCSLHGVAIWQGMGAARGFSNGWPLWRDDHPLYFHSALVTRSFLKQSH